MQLATPHGMESNLEMPQNLSSSLSGGRVSLFTSSTTQDKLCFIAIRFILSLLLIPISSAEDISPEQLKFFESKIRPALTRYCYECHAAGEKIRGGLRVDYKDGLIHGGDSGAAVVPGDLEKSLLFTAVTWSDRDYQMPPKQKLPPEVIEDIRQWIVLGAPDPRVPEVVEVKSEIDIEAGRKFWAFQPPHKTDPPGVPRERASAWSVTDSDRFLLARLEQAGLQPASEATPAALLRRLHFDLIGLPPTPTEIRAFGADWKRDPEQAWVRKVDALLDSGHFGERWGRHWLDVARYAESSGKEFNMTYPQAWRYRDYVVDSLNADKPYDRFITEQIAGDLLPVSNDAEWQENLIATGFLALGPKGLNERNPRQFALDQVDEQIDAMSQAVLGLTISCARCHDHKSDPIPTEDYYALVGIFQSTRTYFGTVNAAVTRRATKLLELPVNDPIPLRKVSAAELQAMKERLQQQESDLRELLVSARGNRQAGNIQQQVLRLRTGIAQLHARIASFDEQGIAKTFAMGVQDLPKPVDAQVLVRGELDKPAQVVARGVPKVLQFGVAQPDFPSDASGRLELAEWLTSRDNPLTARVMVNRIWSKLFGAGLVTSMDNFGVSGNRPSHPELLDTLAVQFMEDGWSVKNMIRHLVLSRAYRMSTRYSESAYQADADNVLLWRQTPRRLDAESLRDAMLMASGELELEPPLGSLIAVIGDANIGNRLPPSTLNRMEFSRSLYLPAARNALPEAMNLFDAADNDRVTGQRDETNVPGQSLYLMNNAFVEGRARAMADRLWQVSESWSERMNQAFLIAYGRFPTSGELTAARDFFQAFARQEATEEQALTTFCQALYASAEFRYLN